MNPDSYGIVQSDHVFDKMKNMSKRLKLRQNPISHFFENDHTIKFVTEQCFIITVVNFIEHDDVQKAAVFNVNAWPSSIAVESDFSKVKKLVSPDRCGLKPARVNDYMTGSSGLEVLRKVSSLRKRKREDRKVRVAKKPRV